MPSCREFVVDKGFDLLIAAPAGGAIVALYAYLWGHVPWPLIIVGVLVSLSLGALVEFVRYENRRKLSVSAGLPRDIGILLGTWRVLFSSGYSPTWTFKEDGSVSSTHGAPEGRWFVEGVSIRIKWIHPQDPWETLQRPLAPPALRAEAGCQA